MGFVIFFITNKRNYNNYPHTLATASVTRFTLSFCLKNIPLNIPILRGHIIHNRQQI